MVRSSIPIAALALAASFVLSAVNLSADVVAVTSMKDNTLYQSGNGSLSNGAGESFFAGRTNQFSNYIRRGLVAFDVAGSVPGGSTITGATLSLYCHQTISGNYPVSLHRALQDWGESSSDAGGFGNPGGAGTLAAPGDATWLHTFSPSSFWTNPGGDFAAAPSAVSTVGSCPDDYHWTDPAMVLDVQSWLDNPAGNFGWVLIGNEDDPGTAKRFATRETTDIFAFQPTLTIEYIPEPGVASLLVIGLLAMSRRRRG